MEKELTLTPGELQVCEEFAKGLQDKEVADRLGKSIWTVKTQKKMAYLKLGIQNSSELTLYVICRQLGKEFDLKKIREFGISVLFSMLFMLVQVAGEPGDMCRTRGPRASRARTEIKLKD